MYKILVGVLLIFIGVMLYCYLTFPGVATDIDMGKPLDLKFTAVDGRKVDLSQMRGKVVLIDFWATWCAPCRTISPELVALYKKYHSQGLEIIGISMDSDKQAMLDFVKKEDEPWPQYFEESSSDNVIASRLGIASFPTVWLVNRKGVVVNPNFRELWAQGFGIPLVTSDATRQKVDAAVEKQLKEP